LKTIRALTFLVLAALTTAAYAAPAAAAPAAEPARTPPGLADWTLPNGLRVLVLPRASSPSVAVLVFYHAGSKDEPATHRGIAHLFEHMMFKGTGRVPPEAHTRYINQLGGASNAFTTDDLTAYEQVVPPAALEFTLSLEADRMRGLQLSQALLDSEREVVKEELRMRFENNPVMTGVQKIMSLVFTKHPYGMLAIGTKEMLDKVTVEECKKFYDLYYQPNNATVVLVGNVTEADARKLVDKAFGALPRGPVITRQVVEEPLQTAARKHSLELPMALPLVFGAYHVPGAAHADMYALTVLQEILSSGESSRLYRRVVAGGLGIFAGGFLFDHEQPGVFVTFAQVAPGVDPAKAQAAIDDEIAKVMRAKVTPAELRKAKNQLAVRALDERERAQGLATAIGMATLTKGDPQAPFRDVQRFDAVSADDVLAVALRYLVGTNQTALALRPKQGAEPRTEAPPAARTATAPTPRKVGTPLLPPRNLPVPKLDVGEVVRETLSNGLSLLVVPRHELPLVEVALALPTGDLDNPIEQVGLVDLAADMLRRGAGKRSALQIAQLVDGVGGSLDAKVDRDYTELRCRARAGDLGLCLELLADQAMRPTFPEAELKQVRTELVANHVHEVKDDVAALAMLHGHNAYFGDLDPRGRPISERSAGSIRRADLVKFHGERFRPDGATLVVSGDVEPDKLRALLGRPGGFARWASRGALPARAPATPAAHPPRVRLVDKPDSTQTALVLVGPGIAHRSPDLFALEYVDYVLAGGDFSSRLMQVVRSAGGKAYGVQSRFEKHRDPGVFEITTQTRVAESGRTLKLILGEIDKLRREGITAAELEETRGNLVGQMAISLETPRDLAHALWRAQHDGLPVDHVEKATANLAAVTLEAVKRACARYLGFDTLVAVGPAAAVRPLLEEVGQKIAETVPFDAPISAADRR
jgi:zinc protease